MMFCVIWQHLYNLENVKNHGGVLLLVKLQALKVTLLHGCLSRFLNCIKSRNGSHINFWGRVIKNGSSKIYGRQSCDMVIWWSV